MDRRGFLGSILGTIIASRTKFIADATPIFPELLTPPNFREEVMKFYYLPERFQREYQFGLNLANNPAIIMTPVKEFIWNGNQLSTVFEPVHMEQTLDVRGLVIFKPDGTFMGAPCYNSVNRVNPGDTLNQYWEIDPNV